MVDLSDKAIGIIGSGMIGTSLAALFTGNGFSVTVLSVGPEFTQRSKDNYKDIFKVLLEKNLVTVDQFECCAKRLSYTESYRDLSEVSFIFECAPEDIDVKHVIFEQIELNCRRVDAIASTTSALSADDLADGLTKYKDKMLVAHPFYPPHLIPFVELVKSAHTDPKAAESLYNLLEYCGRKAVIMAKSAPGFIANRLQHALLREAVHMVEQGYATPGEIDKALMYSFMPRYTSVGLFEHQDAAGLDMVRSIQSYLLPDLSNASTVQTLIAERYESGRLGQKTGSGIYEWTEDAIEDFRIRAAQPYWGYFNWRLKNDHCKE